MQTKRWIFHLPILAVLCEYTILDFKQTSMQTQHWIFHLPDIICSLYKYKVGFTTNQYVDTKLDNLFTDIRCSLCKHNIGIYKTHCADAMLDTPFTNINWLVPNVVTNIVATPRLDLLFTNMVSDSSTIIFLFLSLKTDKNPILKFVQIGNTGNINIGNQKFFNNHSQTF